MQIILIGVAILVTLCVFYFCVEGFQKFVEGFVLNIYSPETEKQCKAHTSCSTCLADSLCGWASDFADPVKGVATIKDGTIVACIPQSGGKPFITSDLNDWMIAKNGSRVLTNFISSLSKCTDITCTDMLKCGDCAFYDKCTWQQVMDAAGAITQSCKDTEKAGAASTTVKNIKDKSTCPPPQCSDVTDCVTCANTTGCSFCVSSGKCLKNSEFGAGSNQCATAKKIDVPAKCPCDGITDCVKCADRVGCGYCKENKTCVNLDAAGMPPTGSCTTDNIFTNGASCNPGGPDAPASVDTRTAEYPTAAQIYAASHSGELVPGPDMKTQNNIVRPKNEYSGGNSTEYRWYTANGVARKVGSGSIPDTVRKDNSLDTPLETYVKELVNSQLAAQGVPTNEPFQVNETSAIPNASDYMKKMVGGIFSESKMH